MSRTTLARGLAALSLGALSLGAALAAAPGAAAAQSAIAIADFDGPAGARLRTRVARSFDAELVPSDAWRSAVRRLGEPTSDGDWAALAAEVGARAIVVGRVFREGGWRVDVVVRNGADGRTLGGQTFESRSRSALERELQQTAADALAEPLGRARPPVVTPPAGGGATRLVVVRPFEGPSGDRLRGTVVGLVEDDPSFDVVDPDVVPAADVDATVEGRVERFGREWVLTLRVLDGASGRPLETAELRERSAARLRRAVQGDLWGRLGPALGRAESRTRRAPPPPPPPPEAEAEAPSEAPRGPRSPAVELAVEAWFASREFTYTDDVFGTLRPYELPLWPFVAGELVLYPGAFGGSDGPFAHLGVFVMGDVAPGLTSTDPEDNEYGTTAWGLSAGLRYRVPVDRSEIGVLTGYGVRIFRTGTDAGGNEADVPDWEYQFLRLGADGRVSLVADLFLRVRASYLVVTGTGGLSDDTWFPRNESGGLEAELGLSYELVAGLEARLGFLYRRFWFSMNPEPGDARVAGGALDQTFVGTLGVGWRGPR